jgi:hypothetical protein
MSSLDGVKVGDKLFHDDDRPAVSTVVKVTKLHAINDMGTKYNIRTGWRAGAYTTWDSSVVTLYDEARHGAVLREFQRFRHYKNIRQKMNSSFVKELTCDQLDRINAIMKEKNT